MSIRSAYFYCRNEEGNLQEDVISLVEGLQELGVTCFSCCDYWQRSLSPGDLLLRSGTAVADDCDVVVVSYTWPYCMDRRTFTVERRPLPKGLFKAKRKYATVYMDSHDGYRTVSWEPEFRHFDLILRSKFNIRTWHPSNMKPWAHGLNNRILEATAASYPFTARQKAILVNFGASHPYAHGTRVLAQNKFEPGVANILDVDRTTDDLSLQPSDPFDALMWKQTGARFSRDYYERLKRTQAVACFCGDMIPPLPFKGADKYLVGGRKARIRRMMFNVMGWFDRRPSRAIQWDSFRFWESLAAGCAVFNIDLERYGVSVPVMPKNWEHYIGVDLERVEDALARVADEPSLLERIGGSGRAWAMQHYSPRAMASRFLGLLSAERR